MLSSKIGPLMSLNFGFLFHTSALILCRNVRVFLLLFFGNLPPPKPLYYVHVVGPGVSVPGDDRLSNHGAICHGRLSLMLTVNCHYSASRSRFTTLSRTVFVFMCACCLEFFALLFYCRAQYIPATTLLHDEGERGHKVHRIDSCLSAVISSY